MLAFLAARAQQAELNLRPISPPPEVHEATRPSLSIVGLASHGELSARNRRKLELPAIDAGREAHEALEQPPKE